MNGVTSPKGKRLKGGSQLWRAVKSSIPYKVAKVKINMVKMLVPPVPPRTPKPATAVKLVKMKLN